MADDTLFDLEQAEKDNIEAGKDPLDTKQRIFLNKYVEYLASCVEGPKVRAYMYAYLDGATPENRKESYHGAKVSMVAQWRLIERKLGMDKLAHEMGLDNYTLLGKLRQLMEVQRPMMRKTESGEQEPVFYADGPVQLKATETLIRLANEVKGDPTGDRGNTLNVVFSKSDDMSNVEIFIPKKDDELVSPGGQTD